MYPYEMNFQKILQTYESKTINIHHQWKVTRTKIFSIQLMLILILRWNCKVKNHIRALKKSLALI